MTILSISCFHVTVKSYMLKGYKHVTTAEEPRDIRKKILLCYLCTENTILIVKTQKRWKPNLLINRGVSFVRYEAIIEEYRYIT